MLLHQPPFLRLWFSWQMPLLGTARTVPVAPSLRGGSNGCVLILYNIKYSSTLTHTSNSLFLTPETFMGFFYSSPRHCQNTGTLFTYVVMFISQNVWTSPALLLDFGAINFLIARGGSAMHTALARKELSGMHY